MRKYKCKYIISFIKRFYTYETLIESVNTKKNKERNDNTEPGTAESKFSLLLSLDSKQKTENPD